MTKTRKVRSEWPRFEWPPLWLPITLAIGIIAVFAAGFWLSDYRGAPVEGTAVMTVLELTAGYSGRWGSNFDYRVRLPDGRERRITVREGLDRGSRVKVNYREYRTSDKLDVLFYAVCDGAGPC